MIDELLSRLTSMKKKLIAAATLALAIAYPATCWFVGQRLEAGLEEQQSTLKAQPYLRIVERNFRRGLFSSSETLIIEIPSLPADLGSGATENQISTPLRLTLKSNFRHLPLPEAGQWFAIQFQTELQPSSEQQALISKLYGSTNPLEIAGHYGFSGESQVTLSNPPFSLKLPASDDSPALQVNWQGFQLTIDSDGSNKEQRYVFQAPGFAIGDGAENELKLADLRLDGKQSRYFDDDPLLQAGNTRISVAEASLRTDASENPMVMKAQGIVQESMLTNKGEHLDLLMTLNARSLQIAEQQFGPAAYDFSLRHLHARSFAALYRQLVQLEGQLRGSDPSAALGSEAFLGLLPPLSALLKEAPEFRIDRIAFATPGGQAQISAVARLGKLNAINLENPLELLSQLELEAAIRIPPTLLGEKIPPGQLEALVEQAYVQREGELLSTQLRFAKGQLLVSGKPFDPRLLNAPLSGE